MELGLADWHYHHKTPYHLSKDDGFSNLLVLHESVHQLVHLKDTDKIKTLLKTLKQNKKQKEKVNDLQKTVSKRSDLRNEELILYN
jgi:RNA-directed DNA polymerase